MSTSTPAEPSVTGGDGPDRCTVVIADDHALTRDGLRTLLTGLGYEVVGEVENGLEAISAIKRLQPRLAVLDVRMPHSNGVEVYFEVRRWSPGTRVLVMTGLSTAKLFQELVAARVDGLFLKTSPTEAVRAALPRILAGQKVIAAEVQALLDRGDPKAALTARELQVLQALARGETNQVIGARLGISPRTVDTHRTNLMAKLDVHSAAALVAQAMRDGLLD